MARSSHKKLSLRRLTFLSIREIKSLRLSIPYRMQTGERCVSALLHACHTLRCVPSLRHHSLVRIELIPSSTLSAGVGCRDACRGSSRVSSKATADLLRPAQLQRKRFDVLFQEFRFVLLSKILGMLTEFPSGSARAFRARAQAFLFYQVPRL